MNSNGLLSVSYGLVRELLAALNAGRLDRARRIAEEMLYGPNSLEDVEDYCDNCSHEALCDRHKNGNWIVKKDGFSTVHFSEE